MGTIGSLLLPGSCGYSGESCLSVPPVTVSRYLCPQTGEWTILPLSELFNSQHFFRILCSLFASHVQNQMCAFLEEIEYAPKCHGLDTGQGERDLCLCEKAI